MARLVYDGDCPLCRRSVAWMGDHDRRRRLEAVPSQAVGDELQRRGLATRAADTVLWLDGDRVYEESAAAVRALWHLGGVGRLYGALLWIVPRPVRDAGYRAIARRRHRPKARGKEEE